MDNSTRVGTTYAARLSAGSVFRNPYNATLNILWSKDNKSNLFRSDLIVYLNIIGVLYVLFHSIYLRKLLVGMSFDLDKKEISPSDFGVVVRYEPKNLTKEKIKEEIEKRFADKGVKVEYVNPCFNIS